MSAERRAPKPFASKEGKDALSELLDFGPDPVQLTSPGDDAEARLKRILEQLEEINQRIDRLSSGE